MAGTSLRYTTDNVGPDFFGDLLKFRIGKSVNIYDDHLFYNSYHMGYEKAYLKK